jgi:hypothetical protein
MHNWSSTQFYDTALCWQGKLREKEPQLSLTTTLCTFHTNIIDSLGAFIPSHHSRRHLENHLSQKLLL